MAESINPIKVAGERHKRRLAREDAGFNDQRLNILADHAVEVMPITRKERFKAAFKKAGVCLSVLGEALIAEQRNSPYTSEAYATGSFVSALPPMPLQSLATSRTEVEPGK